MTLAAVDPDTRAVVAALREAKDASGLPAFAFARATGTSPSRLSSYLHGTTSPSAAYLMRAQRISAALAGARAEGVPTSLDAAASLRTALESRRRPSVVLRFALEARDRLRDVLEHRSHLVDAWDARPPALEKPGWDALLAALVEHEFVVAGRRAPSWCLRAPLEGEWLPAKGRRSVDDVRALTPGWLRAKGILLAEPDLVTA